MSIAPAPHTATQNLRSWVEVDLAAVRHNALVLKERGNSQLMAIIKADGYGHGATRVAMALLDHVTMFGVANLQEALELRSADIRKPIFLLGACIKDELPEALRHGFGVTVNSTSQAEGINELASQLGVKAQVHAVIDTGMGRLGFREDEWQSDLIQRLVQLPHLHWEGIASHLPVADEDVEYTRAQIQRFQQAVQTALTNGLQPRWVHLCNSAGIMGFQEAQHFCNLARPGLALYGVSPLPEFQNLLRHALTWKTRITLLRDLPIGHSVSYGRTIKLNRATRVATLACGYADGYPRQASNQQADVLIQGRRCPLLGRVTMDQIMVDVTDLPDPAQLGDEAVLLGSQGSDHINANELAAKAGTIAWHIFTGIGRRVARLYPV